MNDIVERLRALNRSEFTCDPAIDEAADEIDRLRAALKEIADRHVPDQPASSGDEAEYVRSHHTALRRMALAALINTPDWWAAQEQRL
jgi:hypothetical protein